MERLIFPVTKKEAEKSERKYSSENNKNALFPSQLRELRKEKGISQETLARDLGVSKSTIGLYETGDTLPDAKTLHDLAVYFGVSSDWLLGLSKTRSNDIDVQKICKKTGLSEHAVTSIIDLVTPLPGMESAPSTLIDSLNDFLEHYKLTSILVGASILKSTNEFNVKILDKLDEIIATQKELGKLPENLSLIFNNIKELDLLEMEKTEKIARFELIENFSEMIGQLYPQKNFASYYHFFGPSNLEKRLANFARINGQEDFADFIEGVGDYSDDK